LVLVRLGGSRCRVVDQSQAIIYREAFNHAWEQHAADPRQEEIALRVAWAAVEKVYTKLGRVGTVLNACRDRRKGCPDPKRSRPQMIRDVSDGHFRL
jgi:cation transport regulator ChaB